jgi:hypothetical protein
VRVGDIVRLEPLTDPDDITQGVVAFAVINVATGEVVMTIPAANVTVADR